MVFTVADESHTFVQCFLRVLSLTGGSRIWVYRGPISCSHSFTTNYYNMIARCILRINTMYESILYIFFYHYVRIIGYYIIFTGTGAEFYYSTGSERSEFLEQPVNSACPRAPAKTPPDTGQLWRLISQKLGQISTRRQRLSSSGVLVYQIR